MDALGASVQSEHNAPSGSLSTLVYRSFGPGRPEAVMDRAYSGTNAGQSFPTYVGDRVYVLGPGADERLAYEDTNGTVYYPHVDRQGSTIALSAGGQNVLTRSYSPYGLPNLTVADVGPGPSAYPYLYTGQRYDAVLLAYDYKARIYSPTDGRFWQTDPVGTKDNINLYGYTRNSPMDGTDPSGQCPIHVCRYGDFPEIEGNDVTVFDVGQSEAESHAAQQQSTAGPFQIAANTQPGNPTCDLCHGTPDKALIGTDLIEGLYGVETQWLFSNSKPPSAPQYPDNPSTKPEDFRPAGGQGARENKMMAIWEKDRGGDRAHGGGGQWKRWPDKKSWENGAPPNTIWPDGRIRK